MKLRSLLLATVCYLGMFQHGFAGDNAYSISLAQIPGDVLVAWRVATAMLFKAETPQATDAKLADYEIGVSYTVDKVTIRFTTPRVESVSEARSKESAEADVKKKYQQKTIVVVVDRRTMAVDSVAPEI